MAKNEKKLHLEKNSIFQNILEVEGKINEAFGTGNWLFPAKIIT